MLRSREDLSDRGGRNFHRAGNSRSLLTLRETVFCNTSNRNCSCSRDAVSAGCEGSARNPCCLVLGSKYCSNIRASCCTLDAVRVSVLLPSSTRSPGGCERQLLSNLGCFQLAEKSMIYLGTKGESYLLNMWSAGFSFSSRVKLSLMQDLCLYRVKIFLFLFLWKSNPVFIFLMAWLNTILPDSVSLDFLLRSLFILLKSSTCTDAPSLCTLQSHSDQMPGYLRTLYFLPLPLIANEKGQTWPKSRITSNLLGWFEDVQYQVLRHKFTWVEAHCLLKSAPKDSEKKWTRKPHMTKPSWVNWRQILKYHHSGEVWPSCAPKDTGRWGTPPSWKVPYRVDVGTTA